MREVEVRILEVDAPKMRRRLKQIGAKKVFEGKVRTNIFDFSNGLLKKKQQMLRLRTLGKQTILCYKGKNTSKKFKCKEEIEMVVDDFDTAVLLLQRLGFKKMLGYAKHRESYKIGKVAVEIDKYAQIPTLIEIEAPTGNEVIAAVKKLGYEMKGTTNLNFPEILKLYKIRK
jgi:adenylate cyclase class 2